MYINDYEVYAGGSKIGKIVMNNEVLYEANSSGDIIIDVTDYSVNVGSTISVIYELEGNVTEDRVSVIYDDTMFTKTGNDFTVIGEGYSEIIYCIDDKPNQTIRVATAYSNDIILDFSQSSKMPEFPSNITYNLKSGSYGFSLTQYEGGGYGLISGNKNVNSSVASGYLKLDLSNIEGTFSVRVTYSYQTESISYDYGRLYLTTTSTVPTYSNDTNSFLKAGGSIAVNNAVVTSPEKTAGIYYLHFLYRKDSSGDTGYDAFCIHKIEILGAGFEYPVTYIEFDSENILCKTGDSININPLVLPHNATEKITYTYDSQFIEEIGNNIICKKSGNTSLTVSSKYVNKNINLVIEPVYISDIVLESSLNLDDTIYEGDSFTITPSTVPLYHDDELICEYDNYYLNKFGNTFEILETAMGQTLTITYRGLNVYKEYTFSVSDKPGFYVEYTIEPRNTSDKIASSYYDNYYYYLPRIYTTDGSTWSATGYDNIKITKKDGTITDDINTLANEVEKIKLCYPENTPSISFYGYSSKYSCCLKEILNINTSNLTDMSNMFYYCYVLTSLDLSSFNTSSVTSMNNMFYYCNKLTSLDLSSFDTSSVTSMGNMFIGCYNLTSLDLSSFDTSNVTTYSSMLSSIPTTVDWHYDETNYNKWTLTESQTGYSGVFPWNQTYIEYTVKSNSDKLNVTKGGNGSYLYYIGLPCTNGYSTSASISYIYDIEITKTDGSVTNDKTTLMNVIDKIKIFYKRGTNISFVGYVYSPYHYINNLLYIDTSFMTNMSHMFYNCSSLTSLDLSNFNTNSVTNMASMFNNCSKLTSLDLSNFNTSNVTDMQQMFYNCYKLTSLDLSNFDTSNVTSMSNMFSSVPSSCVIKVGSKFTLTESQTGFSGTFTRV